MKKQMFWMGIFVVVLVLFSGFAFSQEEVKLLEEAKVLLSKGQIEEVQAILETVRLSLWNASPMRVEKVTFVEERAQTFGIFRPRTSNLFAKGEKLLVYGEPKNYTILKEGDLYHIFFTTDFKLYDGKGNFLGGQEEFGSFRYITQSPLFETFLNLSFDLTGIEAGDYVIEVVVHDKLAGKNTSFRLPFRIR